MLRLLGIPCLQSNSEAEAFCALLNKEGIVMVVLQRMVMLSCRVQELFIRILEYQAKALMFYYCNMEDIESSLGKDMAMKLLLALQGEDILETLKKWGIPDFAASICSPVEKIAYKKAMKVKKFSKPEGDR